MTPRFVEEMRKQRAQIQYRWSTLLRIEPVSSPLANPEMLTHLVADTVDRLLAALDRKTSQPGLLPSRAHVPASQCGLNPYYLFYMVGERALLEVAINIQFVQSPEERAPKDLIELMGIARTEATKETDLFCSVCVHRVEAHCHFTPAAMVN